MTHDLRREQMQLARIRVLEEDFGRAGDVESELRINQQINRAHKRLAALRRRRGRAFGLRV